MRVVPRGSRSCGLGPCFFFSSFFSHARVPAVGGVLVWAETTHCFGVTWRWVASGGHPWLAGSLSCFLGIERLDNSDGMGNR